MTYNKIQDFVEQLLKAKHDFSSATFKMILSNSAITATMTVKSDVTEISAGNGYTAGGMTLDSVTVSETGGTAKVTIADEVLTASGGSIGPFRYIGIFNDTQTSPADPLVNWYDYGSTLTLASGESVTFDFDATNGLLQIS